MLSRSLTAAAALFLALLIACGDTAPSASVVGVAIPGGDRVLAVGQSLALSAEVTVTGGASTAVTWTTSAPGVASVSATGRVEAKEPGAAIITARSAVDGTKSASIQVTVPATDPEPEPEPEPAVLGVQIVEPDQTLAIGATFIFTATVTVQSDAPTTLTWSTSDGAIASIDGATGEVTALAPGSATIAATSTFDTTKSDTVTIAVKEGPPATGIIAGTVTLGTAAAADRTDLRASGERWEMSHGGVVDAPFVPGEVIVGFAPGIAPRSATPLTVAGVSLAVVESIPGLGVQLLANRALGEAATLQLVEELRQRADVRHAQPNYIVQTTVVPDDPLYALQWHYPAINLGAAWDITTGSPDVVVAVVDTGILHSFGTPSLTHPDFVGKVLPGYDFISDYRVAGDGDGRDPDPYDVGDDPLGQSSYHGSHVAGTVAAATNNGIGVAGVDWSAMILPIRALGIGGGTVFDVVEGTLWATGHPIAGVPDNPNPAHVINLSLGGAYTCTAFEQDAFDWIASSSPRRSIVVVAAGNENVSAALFSPASCRNVIAVGATDALGRRAPYSNHGSRVDVMAPGGDLSADRTGDGRPDGVLSVSRDDATGDDGYWFMQGTSMAAPHVAGVASLMKALDPDVSQAEVLAALQATARPLSASDCNRPSGEECGAGLIDAAAALALVRDGDLPTPGVGDLTFEPRNLDFGAATDSLDVTLRNAGASSLAWEATQIIESPHNPGDMLGSSVRIGPVNGTIPAGGTQGVSLEVDRSQVTAGGAYAFAVVFEVQGEASPTYVHATFIKANTVAPSPTGPLLVAAFTEDDDGEPVMSGYAYDDAFFSAFAFASLAGANEVIAWSDENGNAEIDAGDYLGAFPTRVDVVAGGVTSGIDIRIDEIIDLGGSLAAQTAERPSWWRVMEELARGRAP